MASSPCTRSSSCLRRFSFLQKGQLVGAFSEHRWGRWCLSPVGRPAHTECTTALHGAGAAFLHLRHTRCGSFLFEHSSGTSSTQSGGCFALHMRRVSCIPALHLQHSSTCAHLSLMLLYAGLYHSITPVADSAARKHSIRMC